MIKRLILLSGLLAIAAPFKEAGAIVIRKFPDVEDVNTFVEQDDSPQATYHFTFDPYFNPNTQTMVKVQTPQIMQLSLEGTYECSCGEENKTIRGIDDYSYRACGCSIVTTPEHTQAFNWAQNLADRLIPDGAKYGGYRTNHYDVIRIIYTSNDDPPGLPGVSVVIEISEINKPGLTIDWAGFATPADEVGARAACQVYANCQRFRRGCGDYGEHGALSTMLALNPASQYSGFGEAPFSARPPAHQAKAAAALGSDEDSQGTPTNLDLDQPD